MHEQIAGEEASVYSALVLGTRDYMHKCGFQKAIIGLSGGIDSALTAVIAADAVGPENVIGVGMPGPYSSPGSIDDARVAGKESGHPLRVDFDQSGVRGLSRDAAAMFSPGTEEDVTEENIQSRARGMLLMALSNKFGAIVLSTGNKSELGVGYCTLYGDMAGGLAVISDVPKTLVYRLSEYVNSREPSFRWPRSKSRLGGVAARSKGQRLAAALRNSRCCSRRLRGRRALSRSKLQPIAASISKSCGALSAWSIASNTSVSRQRPGSRSLPRLLAMADAFPLRPRATYENALMHVFC